MFFLLSQGRAQDSKHCWLERFALHLFSQSVDVVEQSHSAQLKLQLAFFPQTCVGVMCI